MHKLLQKISKKPWIIILSVVILLPLMVAALDCRLAIVTYEIDAEEISNRVRIALVTDLHSCYYGKNQTNLLTAIAEQQPDLVLLGGDIFDDEPDNTNTERFLSGISGQYPCFYVTGNHEIWAGEEAYTDMMTLLNMFGIRVLHDETVELEYNGTRFQLSGIDDPDIYMLDESYEAPYVSEQLDIVTQDTDDKHYHILLAHRPEYFASEYQNRGFDLVLCGHTHGGQVRIPYLLNGLFAPTEAWFPKYGGGRYEENGTTMIISRGLARESTPVPRVFNRPELVIIDLT